LANYNLQGDIDAIRALSLSTATKVESLRESQLTVFVAHRAEFAKNDVFEESFMDNPASGGVGMIVSIQCLLMVSALTEKESKLTTKPSR
jgi:hypothetical protein